MSRNERVINAPHEEIFDVILKPKNFPYWVLGTKDMRGADEDWPAVGSSFHHSVGVGPMQIDDVSTVLEREEPRRLVLRVLTRPLLTAIVRLTLEPDSGGGTRVVMEEEAESGPVAYLPDLLLDWLARMRNAPALQRLQRLIESEASVEELAEQASTGVFGTRRGSPASVVGVAVVLAAGSGVTAAVVVLRRRRNRRSRRAGH
ncbi:MAG: SRPBCC family protein [Actinomycetota bacterium]|nr:SRPBCC family protein [Actinomycetota bacterium]